MSFQSTDKAGLTGTLEVNESHMGSQRPPLGAQWS